MSQIAHASHGGMEPIACSEFGQMGTADGEVPYCSYCTLRALIAQPPCEVVVWQRTDWGLAE